MEKHSKSTDNPYFYLWIICAIIASLYAYGWDILMDFGLLSMEGENKLLRDETVYPSAVSIEFKVAFIHALVQNCKPLTTCRRTRFF